MAQGEKATRINLRSHKRSPHLSQRKSKPFPFSVQLQCCLFYINAFLCAFIRPQTSQRPLKSERSPAWPPSWGSTRPLHREHKSNTSEQDGHRLSAGLAYQTGSENAEEALGTQEMRNRARNRQVTLGNKVTHHAD